MLNLFGYTGLASLAAAAAGAHVTHVDASRKSVNWARENQSLSGLDDRPIRWIVDDALKFVEREGRRGAHYDGIILDPPKFGRGPKGEVWEAFKSLPRLLQACRAHTERQALVRDPHRVCRKDLRCPHWTGVEEVMKDHNGSLKSASWSPAKRRRSGCFHKRYLPDGFHPSGKSVKYKSPGVSPEILIPLQPLNNNASNRDESICGPRKALLARRCFASIAARGGRLARDPL